LHPASAVPVQPPSVRGQEHRPVRAFADGQVDRPGSTRRQRDGNDLAVLAGDGQGPVPTLHAQVPDISAGGLGHPQPVQGEQRDQGTLERWAKPGGQQQRAELVAIERGRVRVIIQPRTLR